MLWKNADSCVLIKNVILWPNTLILSVGSQSGTPEALAMFMNALSSCCGEGRVGFQQGRPGCSCTSAEVVLCCTAEASGVPSAVPSLLEHTNFLLGSKDGIWPEVSGVNWDWAPFPTARAVGWESGPAASRPAGEFLSPDRLSEVLFPAPVSSLCNLSPLDFALKGFLPFSCLQFLSEADL